MRGPGGQTQWISWVNIMSDSFVTDVEATGREPLVRRSDLDEYRAGLARHLAGEWDSERWTAFRVRFGVYGQRQPGVQMIRIKVPGGIMKTSWLRALAAVNRGFAKGDAHITTRQDFQIYSVPLERTPEALEALYTAGLTTREACGNTLRNMTSCGLAGACPREHVDAGEVAARLARSWLRAPLVQHMPRKVKVAVSGCATDCGASAIHDLGLVAVDVAGRRGFRVFAGGGLGGSPRAAVEVLEFVDEADLPVAVETLTRLHQRYSNRLNKNAARVKFLLKRFGEERFRTLFVEEFERLRGLPQRPWEPLTWRRPGEAAVERTPMGVVTQYDGRAAVVTDPPLGLLSSDQLEAVAAIAETAGLTEVRTTRDQNLALLGIPAGLVEGVVEGLRRAGVPVPRSAADVPDVISCPGTTTCRIGITNSQTFAKHVLAEAANDPDARGIAVRVSGCQNSCGLHHVGDFGFHGMAKKIDGRVAPHYQIHIGGGGQAGGSVGIQGPIVPARNAGHALRLLRAAYAQGRRDGEAVRAWAERLGKDGVDEVLRPLASLPTDGVFVDWGESADFVAPPQTKGECAAPFAADDLLDDLMNDALISLDRAIAVKRLAPSVQAAEQAVVLGGRRLLHSQGVPTDDDTPSHVVLGGVRSAFGQDARIVHALDELRRASAVAPDLDRLADVREAVALWLDTVWAVLEDGAVQPLLAGAAE